MCFPLACFGVMSPLEEMGLVGLGRTGSPPNKPTWPESAIVLTATLDHAEGEIRTDV